MKKLVFLFLLVSLILSGCGDKFAKEKEEILKAEQSAMAMQLPQLVKPDYTKNPPPTRQEYEKYWQDFKKLVETETAILDKMRKSDAKIVEIEGICRCSRIRFGRQGLILLKRFQKEGWMGILLLSALEAPGKKSKWFMENLI